MNGLNILNNSLILVISKNLNQRDLSNKNKYDVKVILFIQFLSNYYMYYLFR